MTSETNTEGKTRGGVWTDPGGAKFKQTSNNGKHRIAGGSNEGERTQRGAEWMEKTSGTQRRKGVLEGCSKKKPETQERKDSPKRCST